MVYPPNESLQINVDIATNVNGTHTGIRMVARDSARCFIAACSLVVLSTFSPAVSKVIGVRNTLSSIKNNSWQISIIEFDASMMVVALIQLCYLLLIW